MRLFHSTSAELRPVVCAQRGKKLALHVQYSFDEFEIGFNRFAKKLQLARKQLPAASFSLIFVGKNFCNFLLGKPQEAQRIVMSGPLNNLKTHD